ncbi:MAG: tRNA epoxyqueuosine(34) reductase QueG [Bacteroidales bacterium]|jgi:epoxyqueuosine reductase|nr:tRNA epoxyqueuosine(34) reductase QueG [Bacteroidales bacterium]
MSPDEKLSILIKQKALELGFNFCGISKARRLDEEAPRLESWLRKGHHGKMAYMENHFDKRLDPRLLVEDARSVISLMISYSPQLNTRVSSELKVSKYAWGADYHFVIKEKLNQLVDFIAETTGPFSHRVFVDSAPVLDRAWAVNAGLGWIGRNTMLISRRHGSFFFLAEIIADLTLTADNPFGGNYCGDCTRCMDACPTGALTAPHELDAKKCISYLTIELKDAIPEEFSTQLQQWIFGCDVCQDVCPWNRFSIAGNEPAFQPEGEWTGWTVREWQALEKTTFKRVFGKSPLTRAGFLKLKNNISFALSSAETKNGD